MAVQWDLPFRICCKCSLQLNFYCCVLGQVLLNWVGVLEYLDFHLPSWFGGRQLFRFLIQIFLNKMVVRNAPTLHPSPLRLQPLEKYPFMVLTV